MAMNRAHSSNGVPESPNVLADEISASLSRFLVACVVPRTPGGESSALVDVLRQLAETQAAILKALTSRNATEAPTARKEDGAGDLLTKQQAMKLCGMKRSTWDTYRHAGYVPQPIRVGNLLRWERSTLLDWIAAGAPRGQR